MSPMARTDSKVEPGDWIEIDYPEPEPLPINSFPPPDLGWGKHIAQIVSVHGPSKETPTRLPCLAKVRIGGELHDELIAFGDFRKLSPLEQLALVGI